MHFDREIVPILPVLFWCCSGANQPISVCDSAYCHHLLGRVSQANIITTSSNYAGQQDALDNIKKEKRKKEKRKEK